jgi:hypothetical protein
MSAPTTRVHSTLVKGVVATTGNDVLVAAVVRAESVALPEVERGAHHVIRFHADGDVIARERLDRVVAEAGGR